MKGELKAGGLALVIKAFCHTDIGKCVTLVQVVQPGESFTAPDGTHCRWRENYPPCWLVAGDILAANDSEGRNFYGWGMFEPCALMPIDGDDHQEPDQLAKDKPAELTA